MVQIVGEVFELLDERITAIVRQITCLTDFCGGKKNIRISICTKAALYDR